MQRVSANRHQSWLTLVLTLWFSPAAMAVEDERSFASTMAPFFEQYCLACHGPDKPRAGVRLDQLDGFRTKQQHLWTKILEQLATGSMPPKERRQPTVAERRTILAWIRQQAASRPDQQTGQRRRLNRRELNAALHDLTGLRAGFADALPEDGKVDGFDTGAEGLQDAADSVAQLLRVTQRAVESIRFLEPTSGPAYAADLRQAKDPRKELEAWKKQGVSIKVRQRGRPGEGLLLAPKWVGERGGLRFHLPLPAKPKGIVRMKLTVAAYKPFVGLPDPHLWIEIGERDIDYAPITGTPDKPQQLIYDVPAAGLILSSRGLGINLCNRIEVPYTIDGFPNEDKSRPGENIPGGTGLFRPKADRKRTPPEEQPYPFVLLQAIEIQPTYIAAWPPQDWELDLPPLQDDDATARRLLQRWLTRAWRRPVIASEVDYFLALYTKLRAQQFSFDQALRAAFQAVLLSGRFRYLASPADRNPTLAQHAIATRLSMMLWGTPPDIELRQLAAAGKLRNPAVLDAQVERLLADPRSAGFFQPFVTQWLAMDQPITVAMDHLKKQDFRFARYLKESMRQETIAYFSRLVTDNRPARELIDSDWTMMNDILAHHYGYPDITGSPLHPVRLRDHDPRGGGILSHAGIQSMLCWMGENWVIYRGAWTLRHLLDDSPPPPPLEVPELIPSDRENRGKTMRELLQRHQQDARCSVCHRKMDPLGFAFQNFDLSGRWRTVEHQSYTRNELDGKIEWRGVGKTRPVDARGRLPRGEPFANFAECKQLLVKHYQTDLARGLIKRWTLYATGRQADVQDLVTIDAILGDHADQGYRLQDLLKAFVRSTIFLDRVPPSQGAAR